MGPVPEGDCEGPQPPYTIVSVVPGHSYYLHAEINDRRVSFLVDTGSAFTILRRDTWEKASPEDKKLDYCGKSFVSVDGSHLAVHGSCVVPVSIDGKVFNQHVYVMSGITTEALLGLDFLESHQCSFDAGKKTFSFSESGTKVLLRKGDDVETINSVNSSLSLRLKNTVKLPPLSELETLAVADIQHPAGGTWLVEGQSNGRHPVMVARGVVTANDEAIPIRLLNPSTEEVTLYGRSCVATASPVCETQIAESTHHPTKAVGQSPNPLERDDLWQAVTQSGDSLTNEQKEMLFLLLSQYTDVFASHPEDYGRTGKLSMKYTLEMLPPSANHFAGSHLLRKRKSPNFYKACIQKGSSSLPPACGPLQSCW